MAKKKEIEKLQKEIALFWERTQSDEELKKRFLFFMEGRDISRVTVYRNMRYCRSLTKIPLYGWHKCMTDFINKEDG